MPNPACYTYYCVFFQDDFLKCSRQQKVHTNLRPFQARKTEKTCNELPPNKALLQGRISARVGVSFSTLARQNICKSWCEFQRSCKVEYLQELVLPVVFSRPVSSSFRLSHGRIKTKKIFSVDIKIQSLMCSSMWHFILFDISLYILCAKYRLSVV